MPTHPRSATASFATITALTLVVGAPSVLAQTSNLDRSVTVTGQGSTFVSNFVEQCKADVKNEFGINVSYQPTGSGAGRNAYINGTNDFAGSDVGFSTAEAQQAKAKPYSYIPVAIGGIAVIYRVPGVSDLKFSAPTLAKIFSGSAQKWNDEAIVKDNPGVTLPGEVIRVIVRSDSSGTSNVFSDYLASAGRGVWSKGATNSFPVPPGNGIAQRGSDGVANYVAGNQGEFAITYAEASFAEERKLSVAKVINAAGNPTSPTADAITDSMHAAAVNDDGTLLLNFNVMSSKAYPISTTAYLIVPQTMDKAKGDVLRTFLTYSLTECQNTAAKLGYAPLPASLAKLGLAAVNKINPGSAPVPTAAPGAAALAASTSPAPSAVPTTAAAAASSSTAKPAATKTSAKKSAKTTKRR